MATITYQCSICERNIDLVENPIGLTTLSKCVITYGCKGKLLTVKRNQDNIRESFPAEVPGLVDYSPRNVLSNFTQIDASTVWIITHNLNTVPALTVFVNNNDGTQTELNVTQYQVFTISQNQTKITFPVAYSGSVQLISRNSIKLQPAQAPAPTVLTQVTANGNFVFAIPKYLTKFTYTPTILPPPNLPFDLSAAQIRIEVAITKPNEETIVCTEFLSPILTTTAWNGWSSILVRKRKNYYVFAINILNFRTFGGDTTAFSDIPNGTQLVITRVDYGTGVLQPIDTEGLYILLANSPYTINDKIQDSLVDVGDMVDNDINYFTYNTSDFFVDPSNVDKTYPVISKVNPVIPIVPPVVPSPTPTITPTSTPPITHSITPSVTLSLSPTPAISISATPTTTPPPSASVSASLTPAVTQSVTPTPSTTVTPTISLTPSVTYSPIQLFQNTERGAWYDPSDLSTMFQDINGTIPVTTVGQSVLMLMDKSGNGNHLYNGTQSQAPTLQNDGTNNYLQFTSANSTSMYTNQLAPLEMRTDSLTVWIAGKPDDGTGGNYLARSVYGPGGGRWGYATDITNSGGQLSSVFGYAGVDTNCIVAETSENIFVGSFIVDRVNNQMVQRYNDGSGCSY